MSCDPTFKFLYLHNCVDSGRQKKYIFIVVSFPVVAEFSRRSTSTDNVTIESIDGFSYVLYEAEGTTVFETIHEVGEWPLNFTKK